MDDEVNLWKERQAREEARRALVLADPEAAELCAPGWPRKTRPYTLIDPVDGSGTRDIRLPVPWVNATEVAVDEDWLSFRPDVHVAHEKRLCAFCGEAMERTSILGRYRQVGRETSGPGLHPRCMWMAVKVCPHFTDRLQPPTDDTVVAWRHDGPGLGYDPDADMFAGTCPIHDTCTPVTLAALRELARTDPLGNGAQTKTTRRAAAPRP